MTTEEKIARVLDLFGITVVNMKDPVDGSDVAAVSLEDLARAVESVAEKAMRPYETEEF